jgi:hypothetical protein
MTWNQWCSTSIDRRILESTSDFFLALDLGQKRDFTALCLVERRVEMFDAKDPVTWDWLRRTAYHLRHLERLPLGMTYPDVVERVGRLVRSPSMLGRCELVVDATGVGAAVVDLLRAADLRCPVVPVTITGGDAAVKVGQAWRVPKRDLIVGLQVMFEQGEVEIAGSIPETEKFVKELMGMQVKISAAGNDQYGSWRDGEHDDLVLAAALGCWRAKRYVRWDLHGSQPLPGM